ncbi:MAG: hypothetical protein RL442_9 [Pseudomonadota bacterium]|jgi:hypothetical protein
MIETQQDEQRMLQAAMLHAAFNAASNATVNEPEKAGGNEEKDAKAPAVSPLTGAPVPPGRPKGVRNRLTNLRDAVLEAFDQVGGTQYLARLANGTQSDRAAFVSLVSKVLPSQINASVEGGIQVQLSWLGQRSIGTTTAQQAEEITQVIDLERDNGGKYRIKDPQQPADKDFLSPEGVERGAAEGGMSATADKQASSAMDTSNARNATQGLKGE